MATEIWTGETDDNTATATNYRDDDAPDNGDDLIFPAGCDQPVASTAARDLSGTTLVNLTFEDGYTGALGLDNGDTAPFYFKVDADYVYLNNRIRTFLEVTNSTAVYVTNTANNPGYGLYGLSLKGASNALLNIDIATRQSVGVAALAGETAGFTTINIKGTGGTVVIGEGTTVTTISVDGNVDVYIRAACTALNILPTFTGNVYHEKGAATAVKQYGGRYYPSLTQTVGTYYQYGGEVDFTTSDATRTFTNVKRYADTKFDDSKKKLSWGAGGFDNYATDANLLLGYDYQVTREAIA